VWDGNLCSICCGRGYGPVANATLAGKLRKNDSNPGIVKGDLSTPKCPDVPIARSATSQVEQEDN